VHISCYLYLQIPFQNITPVILWSSSFHCSFRYGCSCLLLFPRYSSFQCVHNIVIWATFQILHCLSPCNVFCISSCVITLKISSSLVRPYLILILTNSLILNFVILCRNSVKTATRLRKGRLRTLGFEPGRGNDVWAQKRPDAIWSADILLSSGTGGQVAESRIYPLTSFWFRDCVERNPNS
jgi:hypothetical protein